MTPAEFKAKWPDRKEEINDNCLEDMACPSCGDRGPFRIVVSGYMTVEDDGTEDMEDTTWDEQSPCACKECLHQGIVKDFTIKGLDEALAEMEDV